MVDAYAYMLYRDQLLRDRTLVFDVDIRPGWRAVQTKTERRLSVAFVKGAARKANRR